MREGGPQFEEQPKRILRAVIESWREPTYQVRYYGEGDPRLALLGESHGKRELQVKQRELISTVRPVAILHELWGNWRFDPGEKDLRHERPLPEEAYREEGEHGENGIDPKLTSPNLIALAEELKIPIIGIDVNEWELNRAMIRYAQNNPDKLRYHESEGTNLLFFERKVGNRWQSYYPTTQDSLSIVLRDEFMANAIEKITKKTEGALIGVVGSKHLKGISDRIDQSKTPFVTVNQNPKIINNSKNHG